MTDWRLYLACTGCHALMGQPCYDLSSGGPEALPQVLRGAPHVNRKLSAAKTGAVATVAPTAVAKPPARPASHRRNASRTASKVNGWQAIADRQRKAREAE